MVNILKLNYCMRVTCSFLLGCVVAMLRSDEPRGLCRVVWYHYRHAAEENVWGAKWIKHGCLIFFRGMMSYIAVSGL